MVDRASPTPLWAQIESDLRGRLLRGEYDEAFPTEPHLMSVYEVSRSTIRQAVAALERSGLVERRRGVGTRVSERPLVDSTARMYSLAGWITGSGMTERSVVPICETAPLDLEAAGRLGLAEGEVGVFVMRVRYAGEEPIAIDRSWLPYRVGSGFLHDDLTTGSLYDRLTDAGFVPTSSSEQISPVDPDPDDRLMLGLPGGTMAFRVERTVRAGATPIEYRVSVIRGDRYTLTATWGDSSPTQV